MLGMASVQFTKGCLSFGNSWIRPFIFLFFQIQCHRDLLAHMTLRHKTICIGSWRWLRPSTPQFLIGDTNMLASKNGKMCVTPERWPCRFHVACVNLGSQREPSNQWNIGFRLCCYGIVSTCTHMGIQECMCLCMYVCVCLHVCVCKHVCPFMHLSSACMDMCLDAYVGVCRCSHVCLRTTSRIHAEYSTEKICVGCPTQMKLI